jgi:hypothetical protein
MLQLHVDNWLMAPLCDAARQCRGRMAKLCVPVPGRAVRRVTAPGPGCARRRPADGATGSLGVNNCIYRLRQKLEPDPTCPNVLRTLRAEGYVLVPGQPTSALALLL